METIFFREKDGCALLLGVIAQLLFRLTTMEILVCTRSILSKLFAAHFLTAVIGIRSSLAIRTNQGELLQSTL
jgi:hypothetical protein